MKTKRFFQQLAMSEAKNRNEIFRAKQRSKKYISFEDFIVITRDDSRYPFKTLISTNSVFDKVEWLMVTQWIAH